MSEITPATVHDVLQMALTYRNFAIHKDNAHYRMALNLQRKHKGLGVPVVITSAVVSTAIFSTLQQDAAVGWKITTGLLSLAAAVLAALQTFFNYTDLAQKHLASSRAWSSIRRRLELFVLQHQIARSDEVREVALDELESISTAMTEAESNEPPILERVYNRVKRDFSASRD